MSKPKSVLETKLDEGQQAQLAEWMLGGTPYHQCRLLVQEEFGVRLSSLQPFSRFWSAVCEGVLLARRAKLAKSSEGRAVEAERNPGAFDAASLDALKEKAYGLAIRPEVSAKEVRGIFVLLQKARDQEIKVRQLGLEERRVALFEKKVADAARVVMKDVGLSAEGLREKLRGIFGLTAES